MDILIIIGILSIPLATLLIEVNSIHDGGKFSIDYHDNKPYELTFEQSEYKENGVKWIAFYTDLPHKVEPVISGTRIVLQYDVHVTPKDSYLTLQDRLHYDMKRPPPFLRLGNDGSDVDDKKDDINQYYGVYEEDYNIPNPMKHQYYSSHRKTYFLNRLKYSINNECNKIIGIPLYHLYPQASIKVEYL